MLLTLFLGQGTERHQRLLVLLSIGIAALIFWMYLGNVMIKHKDIIEDAPLVITNTPDLEQNLSRLHYGQPIFTQLEYGQHDDIECRQVRSSVSGLPVGMTFSSMGAIHGTPEQRGFFPFFYHCRLHGQEVAGSLPIMVY